MTLPSTLYIAWTTVEKKSDAEHLANSAVTQRLAVCVQIEGPILSVYRWQQKLERAEEFRLMFKCTADNLQALEKHVIAHHPYETPEWVVVRAEHVAEKYLSWARANSSTPPL